MSAEKNDTEIQKLLVETRKMLADMEHNLEQRHHWNQSREAQHNHWRRQQYYWIGAVVFGCVAILISPFLSELAKYLFKVTP